MNAPPLSNAPRAAFGFFLSSLLVVGACEKKPTQVPPPTDLSGLHMRVVFDRDPSEFVGRFVTGEADLSSLSEDSAFASNCSGYITTQQVAAAGNRTTNIQSSAQVRAALGIPVFADARYERGENTSLRSSYEMTEVMRAVVEDPEGFRQCCQQNPSDCGGGKGLYVSEFIRGTGTIEYNRNATNEIEGRGSDGRIWASAGAEWERGWSQQGGFDDAYFAFRLTPVGDLPAAPEGPDCGWVDKPPVSPTGRFFIGTSGWVEDESSARTAAERDARLKVVQYLFGETLSSASSASTGGGLLENKDILTAASGGVARGVEIRGYCSEEEASPNGPTIEVKVLTFMPNDTSESLTREALEAARDATAEGSPEREQLDAALAEEKTP